MPDAYVADPHGGCQRRRDKQGPPGPPGPGMSFTVAQSGGATARIGSFETDILTCPPSYPLIISGGYDILNSHLTDRLLSGLRHAGERELLGGKDRGPPGRPRECDLGNPGRVRGRGLRIVGCLKPAAGISSDGLPAIGQAARPLRRAKRRPAAVASVLVHPRHRDRVEHYRAEWRDPMAVRPMTSPHA